MSDISENYAQELAETIAEFEKYRERFRSETLEAGQKAKLMKSQVMAKMAPELAEIDSKLDALRQQQANLNTGN
jgi:phage shock protein A